MVCRCGPESSLEGASNLRSPVRGCEGDLRPAGEGDHLAEIASDLQCTVRQPRRPQRRDPARQSGSVEDDHRVAAEQGRCQPPTGPSAGRPQEAKTPRRGVLEYRRLARHRQRPLRLRELSSRCLRGAEEGSRLLVPAATLEEDAGALNGLDTIEEACVLGLSGGGVPVLSPGGGVEDGEGLGVLDGRVRAAGKGPEVVGAEGLRTGARHAHPTEGLDADARRSSFD